MSADDARAGKESRTGESRASASAGGRTDEERRCPGAERWAFVTDGSGRAEGDKDDDGSGYGNGDNGVENNAEGAVVGAGFKGVGVGHLDDGEESEQDEA